MSDRVDEYIRKETRKATMGMWVLPPIFIGIVLLIANWLGWLESVPATWELPLILSIVWLVISAIMTWNKRLAQIEKSGGIPTYKEMKWTYWLIVPEFGILIYLFTVDWRWPIILYICTFWLSVSPMLEGIGGLLLWPWKRPLDPSSVPVEVVANPMFPFHKPADKE
ncbi:MAG: hypothetical protein IH945_11485 [Armatimonadetes bacterium]|nr:hypothetical protein [Armatimonadota bacterium]